MGLQIISGPKWQDVDSVFVSCSDNGTTFQCVKDEKCIPLASKCDGIFDCEDNTDELQCYKKYGL